MDTKLCRGCNIVKPLDQFYVAHLGVHGQEVRRGLCTDCFNLKQLNKKSVGTSPIEKPVPRIFLTDLQIQDIKKRYLNFETLRSIAVSVGVSRSSVSKYVKGLSRSVHHKKPNCKQPIRKLPIKPIKFVLAEDTKPVVYTPGLNYSDYTSVLQSLMLNRSVA